MAWTTQEIENTLHERLRFKFASNTSEADRYFSYYAYARSILISESIFSDIKTIKKDLSDHGENHIMDVLGRMHKLLDGTIERIDAIELYFLCMLALFHDVGNLLEDRKNHAHQDVIRQIYDHIRKDAIEFDDERLLLPEVASKHSGYSSDGSTDTIKELSLLPPHLFGEEIHSKKCAALLRFADELAEGPHRTSIYMNKHFNYPYSDNSIIYHKYAEITKVNIDKGNGRICLTYFFKIPATDGRISEKDQAMFSELFDFCVKRMLKVEAERKYCKYYCDWLEPYKRTHVVFNFIVENSINGKQQSIRIQPDGAEITLDDLSIPGGDSVFKFYELNNKTKPESILKAITEKLHG